jgi:hypothetical protein
MARPPDRNAFCSREYTEAELADIAKPFEAHAIDALRRGDIGRVASCALTIVLCFITAWSLAKFGINL